MVVYGRGGGVVPLQGGDVAVTVVCESLSKLVCSGLPWGGSPPLSKLSICELSRLVIGVGISHLGSCGGVAPCHLRDQPVGSTWYTQNKALIVTNFVGEVGRSGRDHPACNVVGVSGGLLVVVYCLWFYITKIIVIVFSQQNLALHIAGDLFTDLEQAAKAVVVKPLVVLSNRWSNGLLDLCLCHLTHKVVLVGDDLHSGRVEVGNKKSC
jgi:hypothetical protein